MLVIESNTQATEGDLRIAAFNFREESFKDPTGKDSKGMTCALSVFVKDDETKNQKLRVHRGQKFDVAGRAFEVVEVLPSSVKLTIR